YLGPLHGIPIGLKDLYDTAGVATTAGSKVYEGRVPTEDATVVARLKAAGAVIIGKLAMYEFAYGATAGGSYYGHARNPWNTERIPGGSSTGSGAAVASGECLGALGSDTGGSIWIPASLCGIVGLKPTYGLVSRQGVVPLAWSLDHCGPMVRTALDAALMLAVLAGYDEGDPASAPVGVADYAGGIEGGVAGLRVGVPRRHFYEEVEADVLAAVEEALGVLSELGASVQEVEVPSISQAAAATTSIIQGEATTYHLSYLRRQPQDYVPEMRTRLEAGAMEAAVHYVQAQRLRAQLTQEVMGVLSQVDLLVTPTTPIVAPTLAVLQGMRTIADVLAKFSRFTNPFNLAGLPAVSVPCGFDSQRLPIGMQLVAGPFQEATLLRAAHAYQGHTAWQERRPSL
ncbi:MAG: amidase, partial [Dehalococcoidia bacterium]